MTKNFTQTFTMQAEATNGRLNEKPTKKTLDFIKQFARCYHYKKTSKATIGGMIIN